MVPVIHRGGAGGEKLISYLTHDREADTADRLAWTEMVNLPPVDPETAGSIMRRTVVDADILKTRRCGRTARGVLAR